MKGLNFEEMENVSAGGNLTENQTCTIGGGIATVACFFGPPGWLFAAGVAIGALYYGCF